MPNTRRIIRRIRPARHRQVDDQLWPLVVAMVVFGGFVAGTVLAYLRFDDARWYVNAWTWLIAIPLVLAAGLMSLVLTGNRLLRRTMQLAIILCAIIHLVLFVLAIETDVFRRVWTEVLASTERPPERKVVKVPDYASFRQDRDRRLREEFEKPVDAKLPDPVVDETPQQEVQEEPANVVLQPRPVPEPRQAIRPDVVRREDPNEAVPRKRDQMSKLSRRAATVPRQRPTQEVAVPDVDTRSERRANAPKPRAVGVRPQKQTTAEVQLLNRQTPRTTEPSPAVRLSRRVAESQPRAEPTSAAALARRSAKPRVVPRTDVAMTGQPAIARRNDPAALKPNNTSARKQQTRSPRTRQQVRVPTQETVAKEVSRRRFPRQPAPEQAKLAQTPRPVPNRRPRETARPQLTAAADTAAGVAVEQQKEREVEPSASGRLTRRSAPRALADRRTSSSAADEPAVSRTRPNVPRQRAGSAVRPAEDVVSAALPGRRPAAATPIGAVAERVSPIASAATSTDPPASTSGSIAASKLNVRKSAGGNTSSSRRRSSAATVGAASTDQIAHRQPVRGVHTGRPSLSAQASPDQPPRRAARDALSASSPVASERPARVAQSDGPSAAQVAPTPMVLSKAEAGTAGRGESRNLGRGDPASDTPAIVASGSAQRAKATQNLAPGPALSPEAPALVRHGRAGRARPSAVLRATPLSQSALPGSRQPSEVAANSSAALTRSASNAARGEVTASKGTAEVDTGPTTRLAEAGTGRAAGGGRPQRSSGSEQQAVPRAQLGRSPAPALLADVESPVPTAPVADGGGQPSTTDVEANPNALVNARNGKPAPAAGGPRAMGGGPAVAPSAAQASSNRRTNQVVDGPESPRATQQSPSLARRAARDRQLAVDTGVADLSVGNAADHNDREIPAQSVAASPGAGDVDKRATDGTPGSAARQVAVPEQTDALDGAGGDLAGRAEAADAQPGQARVGGGTRSPTRTARGPLLVANTTAQTQQTAGSPRSTGRPDAEPRSTQGTAMTRLTDGMNADRNNDPVGAMASETPADAPGNLAPGTGLARATKRAADSDGPVVRDEDHRGGPGKRAARIQLPATSAVVSVDALPAANSEPHSPGDDVGLLAGVPHSGAASRSAGVSQPVEIEAVPGPGGLGGEVTADVGLQSRRATETSMHVQLDTVRFARKRVGGLPDFNTAAAIATEPFRRRARRGDRAGHPADGTGPETEEAIELGLVFLSRAQASDGRWTLDSFTSTDGLPQLASDTAATGLALLAFQGAGYNHMEHRYADVVRRGIDFLVQAQQPDGNLFVPMDEESNRLVVFYSHSIAALALCEAFGMTQDPALRAPAQKALDFIVATQHPQRGGWRYTPRVGADTSVTGWMMMALRSGELATLKVPDDTYAKIRAWLDRAQASESRPHLYCYNPYAPDTDRQRGGRLPTKTMTSVGLLMRLYSGWRRDNAAMARGARYLLQFPPEIGTATNPRRDTYYWYYATQVMFHMGGEYWSVWNGRLHPLLVNAQVRDGPLAGSWDPRNPVPDRWALFAGRIYVTTMNLLSLEVTYRHLPLYEDTAR